MEMLFITVTGWTIAGSNGIGITTAYEDDGNPSDGKFYNRIPNNLYL